MAKAIIPGFTEQKVLKIDGKEVKYLPDPKVKGSANQFTLVTEATFSSTLFDQQTMIGREYFSLEADEVDCAKGTKLVKDTEPHSLDFGDSTSCVMLKPEKGDIEISFDGGSTWPLLVPSGFAMPLFIESVADLRYRSKAEAKIVVRYMIVPE